MQPLLGRRILSMAQRVVLRTSVLLAASEPASTCAQTCKLACVCRDLHHCGAAVSHCSPCETYCSCSTYPFDQHIRVRTGNDEVACVFVIGSDAELQAYMAEALAPVRAAENKNRTLRACRSLSTASLTELSLSKGGHCQIDVLQA